MLKRLLCLLTIVLLASSYAFSQVTTSSLTGTVRESAGQNLAGATISATHQPTGTRYTGVSQTNGQFTISNMRTGGPYLVTITYVGYETQTFNDIFLQLGEATILNTTLPKANTTLQQVVVTSTARNAILNANRTGATTNIGRAQIQTLPSISRSINDLTRLTPQANGTSIGGGNYRQNFITVDGSDFNNNFGIGTNLPAGGSPISLDALDEISVSVTPYDIRQSGFIGSAINAVTRSGTNNFSGSVYRYWRSEKQQGDKVGDITFTRVPFNFEQYGARIGGPIIKNKLFFFTNFETENQPRQVQTRVASSPGNPPNNTNIARPSVAELTDISNYLREKYGYETGAFDNYNTEVVRRKFLARLDWNISSKHRFNVRYNQVEGSSPSPMSTSRTGSNVSYPGQAGPQGPTTLWFQNSNYFQGENFYSFAAELNSSFGSNITNTFRGNYTNQDDSRQSNSQIFPFVDILKDGDIFTSFGYEPFSFGNIRQVKTYNFVDNLTLNVNNHRLLFGVQYETSRTTNGFQRFATSYYKFNSFEDFKNGAKPTDFALTYSLLPGYEQAFPSFKFDQYSAYVQDEITINPRFRMTLGLRADMPTFPDVTEIRTHRLIDSLTFANGEKVNTGNLPKSQIMWSPRVGFNWDVNGDRSFQLRGGTGIFSGRVPFVWIVSQSGDAGLLQVTQAFNGTANTPGPFNPDPNAYRPTTQPKPGEIIPGTVTALAEDFKFPQTWKTTLAMDKRLGKGFVFSIEGIYQKDINTAIFRNANLVAPQPLNIPGYPDNRLIYPNAIPQKFINTLNNAGRPVTNGTVGFNPIILDNGNKGYYASLTLKLDKQFSRGFSANVAYTKSIASNLFDGGGDQPLSAWQGTASVNGNNDFRLGNSGFVVPDRVIAAVSYRKEYLKHLATTISVFYEGGIQGRFSYVYSTDFNRDGAANNLDLIYIPKDPSEITFVDRPASAGTNGVAYSAKQQSDLFFAFVEQDKYLRNHKGQYAERNGAQTPWRNQFDVRLLQDVFTNIGKKRNTIQFSVDVFNFANLLNPNWGIIRSTNATALLVPQNVAALTPGGATRPTFWLNTVNNRPVTESFRDNVSISSTYYMQFGLRYLFGN
ncbi:MAG: TonB-dependent receptor [Flaviaesturariibacter sp.]|nr:TonB-dependent receptor [Flaviaesturariibacter sp.]